MMKKNGFTLIEFIIYIGIVAIILVVAGGVSLNVLLGRAKLTAIEEVSQNARFVSERIASTVRNASAINSPATTTTASLLSLKTADANSNPTLFDLSSNAVVMQEGSVATSTLTSSDVEVTSLQFTTITKTGAPGTIRMVMTIKSTNPDNLAEFDFEETFYTTANIRKK
jgi:prepilin-type N-terminal cleavage/methylation domain-containing protein